MISASLPGILVTVIVLGVLIAIHEAGHFLAAKSLKIPVRQFAIGFGPRIFGFNWGETECRLNWIPLGGYCAFEDDQQEGKADTDPNDPKYMRNRPIWQRVWVVSAGVIFNFVFAWLLLWGSVMAMGAPTGNQLVYVQKVVDGTPAAKAGLQKGDQIVEVEGTRFTTFMEFKGRLGELKEKPITISVLRDGKAVELPVTVTKEGTIGFAPLNKIERKPAAHLFDAGVSAWNQQMTVTSQLWNALASFVSQPQKMASETGGPIAIVAMGDQVFQIDPLLLIDFAVLLSIELAIINILPLPALDGGHLVLLAIEAVRRKPLPRRLEEGILMSGFVLIMGLGMVLIFKDIMTVPGMYKTPTPVTSPAPAGK